MFTALLAVALLEGPFPLLVTPFAEDATVDIPVLVKEARYVNSCGTGGLIWPTAHEVTLSEEDGSYERGIVALAETSVRERFDARVTITTPGRTSEEAIRRGRLVSEIAKRTGAKMALLARPPDDCTNQVLMAAHYRALGAAVSVPVIIQTYNPAKNFPQPDVSLLIDLAKEFPEILGWIKEESPGEKVNDRMAELIASPAIHTVLSGWGGKGWIYQGPRIGTRGIISQRPAYASLFVRVWRRIKAGADASDPELADAYMKYLYMANLGDVFSSYGDDEMRGPHLYVLEKLGIFRNRLNRVSKGKVVEYVLPEKAVREIYARMSLALGK